VRSGATEIRTAAAVEDTPARLAGLPLQHFTLRHPTRAPTPPQPGAPGNGSPPPPPRPDDEVLGNPNRVRRTTSEVGRVHSAARTPLLTVFGKLRESTTRPALKWDREGGEEEVIASNWRRFWLQRQRRHVTTKRKGLSLIFSCHSLEMGRRGADTPPVPDSPYPIVFLILSQLRKHLLNIANR
jgi:hypothetical protein